MTYDITLALINLCINASMLQLAIFSELWTLERLKTAKMTFRLI